MDFDWPSGLHLSEQLWTRLVTSSAEDKKKLIDTHYGAIAAKAVLMKPKDLIVQEKSQEEFEKMLPGWAGLTSY